MYILVHTYVHVIVVPLFWSVHGECTDICSVHYHVPTRRGVQLLCIPFNSAITSSCIRRISFTTSKKTIFQRAGGRYQSIQMAFWPPALPKPTSCRKLAELTSLRLFIERTKKLAEPTSFRVFTERKRKLAEPTRLRILTE